MEYSFNFGFLLTFFAFKYHINQCLRMINWKQTHNLCLGKFTLLYISREKFEPEPGFKPQTSGSAKLSGRKLFNNQLAPTGDVLF